MRLGNPAARTPSPLLLDPGQDRDPAPPRPEIAHLIRAGAMDPAHVRLPALERCTCGHQPQIHEEILLPFRELGRCLAKPCRKNRVEGCHGYELDPRFEQLLSPNVQVVKLRVGEDGTLSRAQE